MTYVPYYIDKALADATMVGLPINLAVTKNQYEQQVSRQQFQNEVFEMTNREETPQKCSSVKAERKQKAIAEKESTIMKKVVI